MKKIALLILSLVICLACFPTFTVTVEAVGSSSWVALPYSSADMDTYDHLYVVGGYHSIDTGCPYWGSTNPADLRFIGDEMGKFVITYADGTMDQIPLVLGYTMWFFNDWSKITLPFKGVGADETAKANLQKSLHLFGAYEANISCVFKVKVQSKKIRSLAVEDNPAKNGTPLFSGVYLTKGDAGQLSGGTRKVDTTDSFFETHTIDSQNPYPESIKKLVASVGDAVQTYDSEYENLSAFVFPENAGDSRVVFSGNFIANAATGVLYHNLQNLIARTDADGFLHTSYYGSPAWREGFGTWISGANTFYDACYSRDTSRAIMSLLSYGQTAKASLATQYVNKWMMYFPENNKQIMGVDIPGHYTVVVNKPLLYSTSLAVGLGWPTKYTQSAFGEGYQNLGNQETDGHGLMMLANYNLWRNNGATKSWAEENWAYINEGAKWILWCYENSDISFVKGNLLYAESEGGLQKYTLYCNVPCYLGLLGYVEMAQKAGKTAEAAAWLETAEKLGKAIRLRLGNTSRGWYEGSFGFYHDPVVTMMSDYYGYDTADMNEEWVTRSRTSYQSEILSVAANGYFGANGIGYDHAMITQNALLLDQMMDASYLMTNLTKIGYAPGLPDEYLIPESVSVDPVQGIIRRQGDLGNCVQLSEALKCYAITVGVSPVNDSTLKIMPRLPQDWQIDAKKYDIPYANGTVDLQVSYPKDGLQSASVTLNGASGLRTVKFRMGPLPMDTKTAEVKVNGKQVSSTLEVSGDSAWVWVSLDATSKTQELLLTYDGYTQVPTTTKPTTTTSVTATTTSTTTSVSSITTSTTTSATTAATSAVKDSINEVEEEEGGILPLLAIALIFVVVGEAVIFVYIRKKRNKSDGMK